jgi:hypothetical protein
MTASEPLTGGRQCGAVRYDVAEDPVALFVCHCTECRRQSSSAFGITVYVPTAGLRWTAGSPKAWTRPADSGDTVDCYFCGDCGSRLWHRSRGAPHYTSVKGGSLDQPVELAAAIHIWTSRKLPGVIIPDSAQQFPEEPDG